jgi:mRNA interferase RelE/StbE
MKYELLYTKKALLDLRELEKLQAKKIITKLKYFATQSDISKFSKPLKGGFKGLYRFRIGDYRAIFSKDDKGSITILTVIRVKHRKEVYE